MAPFHQLAVEDVFAELVSSRAGLSQREAAARLQRYGPNRLPEVKQKTVAGVFLDQFKSPFIYLLLAASAVSLAIRHLTDAVFILIVLILNAGVGTYQEWRAEQRARALKSLMKGQSAVWRDGRLMRVPAEDLVPGDVVQVESGEKIAADLRLIEAHNLLLDESALTGESVGVHKVATASLPADAGLADRITILHAGTTVQTGRGFAVVIATGRNTIVGQLAMTLERPEPPPPLVRRMSRFTRDLTVVMGAVVVAIAAMQALRGANLAEVVLLAVALTVSAVPEGLPVAMTVALSIAMHRMGLRNVVVRHLPAVEGLGACTLIATDKTGTLTLNRLTIERVWTPGFGECPPDDPSARDLLLAGANASELPAADTEGFAGDAVDLAFFAAASRYVATVDGSPAALAGRVPYEPERRFAAAFHGAGEALTAYVKGAPEAVAAFCVDHDRNALKDAERLSAEGYRVIAVAAGPVGLPSQDELRGLHLLGFAALIDPLRPEAAQAIATAQRAGIRIVMITGDHPLTALAIARQLGLAETREQVVTGAELARLEGSARDAIVDKAAVIARTEPLQKLAIVESLRRQGHVVAVTGDGINDAPALHVADIGIAMGKAGTDVARDAADLILTDDNFASIVAGIEEGRVAYDNLRKVILLLISTGAAEILLMLLATGFGLPPPLTAVQLLWLNLITNGLQDVALAFEQGESGVLQRRPRPAGAPVFDRAMIQHVLLGGLTIGLAAFVFYYLSLRAGTAHMAAQGAVLWLLVWCENAYCFNCRSETRSAFRISLAGNPFLVAAVIGAQLLQLVALGLPPLRDLLELDAMTLTQAAHLAVAGVATLLVMEVYKAWRRARE